MLRDIWEETDENGTVRFATIQTYGDVTHTFVDRSRYNGPFLPGYKQPQWLMDDPVLPLLPTIGLQLVDHVVGNQPDNEMTNTAEW